GATAGPVGACGEVRGTVAWLVTAKTMRRVLVPRGSLWKLWKVRPPMVTVGGHCTVVDGRSPFMASADAVTILKVDPGGKMPSRARSNPPGRSITASTLPVEGWSTTMSIHFDVAAAATACAAAS